MRAAAPARCLNDAELSCMLKKLIFTGVFFGPFILAGVLYLSLSSDENSCNRHFDQMTMSIGQANFCVADADCASIELDHPNYGCGVRALANTSELDEIRLMNERVNENGCRLHLPTYECAVPADDSPVARCIKKQCKWAEATAN